ncbi:MAG: HEAT repeat domain-containing protein [Polyangia bacterium]
MSKLSPASLTEGERERVEQVDRFVALGEQGVPGLLGMLSERSWTVRRAVVSGLVSLAEHAVGPLCTWLRDVRSTERGIAAAADALVASTAPGTDAAVLALADSPVAAVVADAAQILGRRGATTAAAALARLIDHTDDNVAVSGIEAIGRLGGESSVEPLVRAVLSDNFFRTFAAIGVLGSVGDPRALEPLARLLTDSRFADETARALGQTGDRAAIPKLAALLEAPDEPRARRVVLALANLVELHGLRFGPSAALDQTLREWVGPFTPQLIRLAEQADPKEQAALCVLGGRLGDPALIPVLVRLLDGEPAVAEQAGRALERLTYPAEAALRDVLRSADSAHRTALLPLVALPPGVLDEVLCDPDHEVRALACAAAARIGDVGVLERLFALLADPHARVVQAALAAIQALGGAKTEGLALQAAASPHPGLRRAAVRLLTAFGFPSAFPVFVAALEDESAGAGGDDRLRELATYGLAFVDHPEARPRLRRQASSASPRIRAAAMRGLGHCAAEVGLDVLGQGLTDPDPWVRYYACQALGRLGCESAVAALAERLGDDAGQVRIAALDALSQLHSDESFCLLQEAATAGDPDVRRAALVGLGLRQRPEAIPLLIESARSSEAATRLVALSGLAKFKSPAALGELAAAASSDDEELRSAAVSFLAESEGPEADRLLVDLVSRADARHPAHAALSAGRRSRVPSVLAALRTAEGKAASALASALVRMKTPDADAALFEALTLPNVAARKAAARALAELGGAEVAVALGHAAARDPDPEVRDICSALLKRG